MNLSGPDGTTHGSAGQTALMVSNSDNSKRILLLLYPSGDGAWKVAGYSYDSGYTARTGETTVTAPMHYIRIRRDGSNTFYYYWSPNGVLWHYLGSHSMTFTVANAGYRSNSAAHEIIVDWLRST